MTPRSIAWCAGIGLWAVAVGAATDLLWRYKSAPGDQLVAPERWPLASAIRPRAGRFTLVMLAHPRCPCTRASVAELAGIAARHRDRLDAHVLFIRPSGVDESWERSDLWRSAAAIPGVTVRGDQDGAEARRFGALTSGQVVIYDEAGERIFSGGITASRGHLGDSLGRARVAALLAGGSVDRPGSPVFGCALDDPAQP